MSSATDELGGRDTALDLPDDLLDLLRRPCLCFVATSMPDGSPQLTQTWVDTDGRDLLVNSVQGHVKVRNIQRDPRVAVNIVDPDRPARYFAVRGRVVDVTADGAAEHIDKLAQRYTGAPYRWYGGRDQTRLLITVRASRIHSMGG